ncbi:inositol hexakisphosphate and diphosphoinositol-pentakisphosphate kinase 2 isoform X3 [Schistocerca serialis cubense]|uniref:inositol hexakisphosphate and diphosphoinositol-pentakisphosphate kinase 2 isoform X3 n=1 Tax=Schistocerca serialis cubense TaxID=2023355 RepID=UPI00214F3E78|nr:inositol hexakisphosphate and diphosphoinositol-pentakisphosphate kinase 2 isoform X3 [Schistocerca serialis cubense]
MVAYMNFNVTSVAFNERRVMDEWLWWKDWWRLREWIVRDDNLVYCQDEGNLTEYREDGGGDTKQVVVGVCAMAKKSQSKPMKEILTRLEEFEFIKIVIIPEEIILKTSVELWPKCDCLISFHSKGFPLDKAIQYANLVKPFIINNLHMQYDIQDRRKVYSILEKEGIEIPRYAVLDRDSPDPKHHELVESEDHVEVNGIIFNKPFVEKPVSAEDHNIYIYYPTSAGGGSQRLFRKIGSRSSVYSAESRVRKTGSYIYEDFMPTDGTDVKVYTVGPDYAHAEARKSPALDGKVERDSEGKEIRYPVILSNAEKLISRKVCLAFKQTVCGFDLLRANGKSFVCDVNGFSFVKNSNKYYDDCAKILGNMILRKLAPTLHIPWSIPFQLDDPPIVPTTFGKMMELRCVVAIIRHGDRTPKQKMKVEVRHPKFFEIFEKYDGYKDGHVKLKRPKQLQEILDIARSLLSEIELREADPEIEEKQGKLEQLKSVLEMYGHFSGINRKVQMKYQPKGRPRGSSSDDDVPKEPSLVLILKWGGELTPAGRIQAEELGRIFRCMYPGGQGRHLSGEYAGTQGLGLLRLHSTFRHDLKIYASDEGRVQMTAAAFAKGLLALEGELTPILVQMVKSANTNGLLDNDCESSKYQNMAKARLHELMQKDADFTKEDREKINPCNAISINTALDFVKNPVKCCEHVHQLIQKLMNIVRIKKDDVKTKDAVLYHGETWELMGRRWGKIEKDFCTKNKTFDISKIPDIYDCIKYDLQHNQHTLQFEQAEELYIYAKYLADIVIPQEYGLTVQEKLTISQGICTPLLKKIRADLQRNIEESGEETVNRLNPRYSHGVSSPGRHVRTRLYFTSESHVHSLLTVLRYGGLLDVEKDEQWRRAMEYVSMVSELNYMSQIVVMLYEDPTKDPSSEERFHVELHFSPGVNCCVQKNLPPGPGFRPHSRNETGSTPSVTDEMPSAGNGTPGTPGSPSQSSSVEETAIQVPEYEAQPDISSAHSPPSEKADEEEENYNSKATSSQPIPIRSPLAKGISSTEASELALRLACEVYGQQSNRSSSYGGDEPPSPDGEFRSKSYENRRRERSAVKRASAKFTNFGKHCYLTLPSPLSRSKSSPSLMPKPAPVVETIPTPSFSDRIASWRHNAQKETCYLRMLGFPVEGSGFKLQRKVGASTRSLFSTAVISGSSSAPNLRVSTVSNVSAIEGCGGVPPIRPLETLHNALSLKQLDCFLETVTSAPLFRSPSSSPPNFPSTPHSSLVLHHLPLQSPSSSLQWSGPPSFVSSSGASSPNGAEFSMRDAMTVENRDRPENVITTKGYDFTAAMAQIFPTVFDQDLCDINISDHGNADTSRAIMRDTFNVSGIYSCRNMGSFSGSECLSGLDSRDGADSGEVTPVSVSASSEFEFDGYFSNIELDTSDSTVIENVPSTVRQDSVQETQENAVVSFSAKSVVDSLGTFTVKDTIASKKDRSIGLDGAKFLSWLETTDVSEARERQGPEEYTLDAENMVDAEIDVTDEEDKTITSSMTSTSPARKTIFQVFGDNALRASCNPAESDAMAGGEPVPEHNTEKKCPFSIHSRLYVWPSDCGDSSRSQSDNNIHVWDSSLAIEVPSEKIKSEPALSEAVVEQAAANCEQLHSLPDSLDVSEKQDVV